MLYSIPYEYIGKKVDARITGTVIEVFYNQNHIASHRRLYGRKNQYSTVTDICQRIISPISNGMVTASVSGRKG